MVFAEKVEDAIPRAKLVAFENCGHWPQYERRDDFADLNVAFLRSGLETGTAGSR